MEYLSRLSDLMTAALIKANTDAGANIYAPGDWPTDPEKGTAIQVGRLKRENKKSEIRGQPEFTTTGIVTVDGRLTAATGKQALTDIDKLRNQITRAILTNYDINKLVQQFPQVETVQEINSETETHVAQVTIAFSLEYFESQEEFWQPTITAPLESIDLNLDSQNIFDPTGTYAGSVPNTEFPNAINPAPRTQGPDGRNEGYIVVDLPQS